MTITFIVGPTPDAWVHFRACTTGITRNQSLPQELHGSETSLILRLLNGALIEAIRFMKGEPDIVAMYEKMYLQAITLLKSLGDGKLREDAYRSGQFRVPVS